MSVEGVHFHANYDFERISALCGELPRLVAAGDFVVIGNGNDIDITLSCHGLEDLGNTGHAI